MDIFGILTMLGGLAMFLYGMDAMGDGLAKLSGGKLERILEKLTSNRFMALLLGAGVTAIIQSSSATTVMVVGFVNSGIMKLTQAVGIIMGANIGTTMTSWLLSLTQIEGSSFLLKMLKPSSFSPILAVIGIIMIMSSKNNEKKKDIGNILVGFAILMFGMQTMSGAVEPLGENAAFTSMLTKFNNPILGMIAGAVLTAVIQSSSASVGILQALCATGAISFGSAIPIIMGQNIGTCVTALMSSIGASKNAKRASMIHLYFNLIGTILFMVVFYTIHAIHPLAFLDDAIAPAGIAVIHSLFNIGCAIILFPFGNQLVKLATLTIRDKAGEGYSDAPDEFALLDERFLDKPGFAVELCRKTARRMADEARDSLYMALDLFHGYSEEKAQKIVEMEQSVDRYEDALGSYMVKLSNKDLSQTDIRTLSILLHCISEYERISDHAVNIMESAKEMNDKSLEFSKKAKEELDVFANAVREIVGTTTDVFKKNDLYHARDIEPLEQVIDSLNIEVKQRHIRRLRKGKCTIELGLVLQDILTNFERVSDHCSNIAVCMIQVSEDGFETHEYLDILKEENAPWFAEEFETLQKKYELPMKTVEDDTTEEIPEQNVMEKEEKPGKKLKKDKKEKKDKKK